MTDATGRYVVSGLPPDTYYVRARSETHRDEAYDDIPCESCLLTDVGNPIEVSAEAVIEDVDFGLDRLGSISGTITDAQTGDPIPSVSVRVLDESDLGAGSGDTDDSGVYVVGGLPTGSYYVETREFSEYRNEVYDDVSVYGWRG